AHPERDIHLAVVLAGHRLADDVSEPAEEHADHQADPDDERPAAPRGLVQPATGAHHHHEQGHVPEDRPAAVVRDEVGGWRLDLGLGHGGGSVMRWWRWDDQGADTGTGAGWSACACCAVSESFLKNV